MSKKSIVTVLLIVLIGMMITDFNINGGGVFELFFHRLNTESMEKFHIGEGSQEEFSVDNSLRFNADSVERLNLDNPRGSVVLIGEKRDTIKVDYTITVFADTVDRAKDFAKQLNLRKTGNQKVKFIVEKPDNREEIQAIKVAYTIKAPQDIFLDIENKYGKLEVSNFKNGAKLSNAYEKSIIQDLVGRVELETEYGGLDVTNINGPTKIDVGYTETDIANISDDLELKSSYSKLEIQNIKGDFTFETRYGEALLENIQKTDINSDYTEIEISGISGDLTADMNYGNLEIKEVNNNLDVKGDHTDIEIELAAELQDYNLDCETEHGNIDTNFPVSFKEEDNKVKINKKAGTGQINLDIVTEYADIEIGQ